MRRSINLLVFFGLLFVLGFALAHFLTENSSPVRLIFWKWRTKEWAIGPLVSFCFLFGLLFSAFFLTGGLMRKNFELRRLKRENQALQKMIEAKSAQTS